MLLTKSLNYLGFRFKIRLRNEKTCSLKNYFNQNFAHVPDFSFLCNNCAKSVRYLILCMSFSYTFFFVLGGGLTIQSKRLC